MGAILLSRVVLEKAARSAAAENGRYALSCLHIERDGVVATDGRRLFWAPHERLQEIPGGIELQPCREALKRQGVDAESPLPGLQGLKDRAGYLLPLSVESFLRSLKAPRTGRDRVEPFCVLVEPKQPEGPLTLVGCNGAVIQLEQAQGQYPEWRTVVPRVQPDKGWFCLPVDPHYLRDLLDALMPFCRVEDQSVRIWVSPERDEQGNLHHGAVLQVADAGVWMPDPEFASGLLMPIAVDEEASTSLASLPPGELVIEGYDAPVPV